MTYLANWDPFKEFDTFQNRLGDLFGKGAECETSSNDNRSANWAPVVDISEDEQAYVIEAELPRVDKDKVSVRVAEGVLTISGDREFKKESTDQAKQYHRIERSYGRFVRSFRLPKDVEGDQVKAEFKDGVLSVRLPKSEAHKPKEIDIQVS